MPLPSFVKNKPPSESATEIELDLTPMMSMFLILLPFLVSMAVLTHLTILDFSLPPNVGTNSGPSSDKPHLKLTLVIAQDHLLVTYGDKLLDSLSVPENRTEFEHLVGVLSRFKQDLNLKDEMVVASQDRVHLKNIVSIMDHCKTAGFSKIGLSSATMNPQEGK